MFHNIFAFPTLLLLKLSSHFSVWHKIDYFLMACIEARRKPQNYRSPEKYHREISEKRHIESYQSIGSGNIITMWDKYCIPIVLLAVKGPHAPRCITSREMKRMWITHADCQTVPFANCPNSNIPFSSKLSNKETGVKPNFEPANNLYQHTPRWRHAFWLSGCLLRRLTSSQGTSCSCTNSPCPFNSMETSSELE